MSTQGDAWAKTERCRRHFRLVDPPAPSPPRPNYAGRAWRSIRQQALRALRRLEGAAMFLFAFTFVAGLLAGWL